jgi:hypothetical protein
VTNIVGHYISTDSKFEKTSALTLINDSTFIYFYMLGGCQDKIKGKWTVKNGYIILHTTIDRDTVLYHIPDLDSTIWTITKKGIKPDKIIDNGCFKVSAVHLKQKK